MCYEIDAPRAGGEARFLHSDLSVYKDRNRWILESKNSDPEIMIAATTDYSTLFLPEKIDGVTSIVENVRQLFRTACECGFLFHNIISLHASCIEFNNHAIAFTGHSGIGKSTRAQAWMKHFGAQFISGDRPAIRLSGNDTFACGVPWDGKEKIYRSIQRPLIAILEVRRAPFCSIRKLSIPQARTILMQQCFIPMWDNDAATAAISVIRRLGERIPIYRLFCGPNEESAVWTHDILFKEEKQSQIKEEQPDMKTKNGFVLREIVGEHIVMPTGENINKFEGALVLNEVSAFLWENLNAPICKDDLLALLLAEFDVEEAVAAQDLDHFLDQLRSHNLLEEDKS